MKKFIFMSFVLLAMAFSLGSCSSDEMVEASTQTQTSQVDFQELPNVQMQIDSLNQSMFPSCTVQTRSFFGKLFKKILSVVVCDAVGGLFGNMYFGPAGAAGGAILASGLAAFTEMEISSSAKATRAAVCSTETLRTVNSEDIALSPTIVPDEGLDGCTVTVEDSVGYYHNAVLLKLNKSLDNSDISIDNMTSVVAECLSSEYDVPADTIAYNLNKNRTLFENIIDEKLYESSEDDNLQVVIDKWKSLYPDQSNQLDVLGSFFDGISNMEVEDNDGTYLNKVLKIIDESSLSTDMKKNLRNAFIVGNASYQLWNVEE